ncbi:MAG: histone deacetylase [Candidatus Omnitrophica bacterium]|nr:histone deacetylase [Candidatus Omnitrophota bacterium]
MVTGLVYDARYQEHDTGKGHPESPARLEAIIFHLKTLPWFSKLKNFRPEPAEEKWLETVHSSEYIRRAEEVVKSGFAYLDTRDVMISEKSFEIAKLAAGGALTLADQMMAGKIRNGFALVRPPGHHAEREYAMGFCLFNNIAILARYLQKQHRLEKILILDWDVHHGNGTQHTFEEDPSVFYISLHQFPFYPGTGRAEETGVGRGKGATLNCPMQGGSTDQDYDSVFAKKIMPAAKKFKPDAVLISAGFDAHAADPLAQISLSTEFFGWMTERAMEIADHSAGGKILSLLEGGYNLDVLPHCVTAHLETLLRSR